MKVTFTARNAKTGEIRTLDAEGGEYFALRDQLFSSIPDGWKAISIGVEWPEVIR